MVGCKSNTQAKVWFTGDFEVNRYKLLDPLSKFSYEGARHELGLGEFELWVNIFLARIR